jgi:hypothetical protein
VTDAGLAAIPGGKMLKLDLRRTGVSDAGLERLREFQNLRELWLGDTEVSDAGLEFLREATHLQVLHLIGTKVTAEGVAALKKDLPQTGIAH